jgi:hypothetical protein
MYLPNVDKADVTESKISGYLLAVDQPSGRGKALFFRALGFSLDHPVDLRSALLQHAASHTVSSVHQTSFGAKYLIEGQIVGPAGATAQIRSVWFIGSDERIPRLITAYPVRGVANDDPRT